MNKKEKDIIVKLLDKIFPMIAVLGSVIGILAISNEFSDFSKNYREVLLAIVASTIGILISFIALKIIRQKRNGTIFISYSHKDKKFVEKLVQSLKFKRFNVFYDEEVIKIGDNIKDTVINTIDNSDLIIFIISQDILTNDFLKYELKYALEKNKKIMPVIIEENVKVPTEIQGIKYADFSQDYERNISQLTKSLISILSEKSSS